SSGRTGRRSGRTWPGPGGPRGSQLAPRVRPPAQCLHPPWSRWRGYWSSERNWTRSLNFCGGRSLNDGIGGVGLRSVEAIWALGTVLAMWVSTGPGPLLPLSPITWQARQPDSPTTSAPDLNTAAWAGVRVDGGGRSTEFGEPVLAPL